MNFANSKLHLKTATYRGTVYQETQLHQVLMNDELLHLILTEIILTGSRGNLLQLALTCKAFLGPVLENLWKILDSPIPLLSLLPALNVKNNAMLVVSPFRAQHWDRFVVYSPLVKQLTVDLSLQQIDDIPFANIICSPGRPQNLTPSIKELRITSGVRTPVTSASVTNHVFLWACPSTKTMTITGSAILSGRGYTSAIVGGVVDQSPNLQKLEVLWDGNASSLSQCQFLRSLTDLSVTYSKHHPSPAQASYPDHIALLEALSGCVQLQSLTLLAKDHRFNIPQLSETVWKELQCNLERGNGPPAVALPQLRFFSASGDPRWMLQWLTQLEPNLPNIRHLAIDIFHADDDVLNWDAAPLNIEMIPPLLKAVVQCSNLHTLSFGCSNEDYYSVDSSREMYTFCFQDVLRYFKASQNTLQWISIGRTLFIDCSITGENAIREVFAFFPALEGIRFPNDSSILRRSLDEPQIAVLLALQTWLANATRANSYLFMGMPIASDYDDVPAWIFGSP